MKRGRLLFLVVLLCLSLVAVPVSAQEKAVPLPKRVGEEMGKAAVPGTWYLGDTPPNVDDSKPPIVFVQGLRGSAESWWGETSYHGPNDMYAKAYDNGYRTAFVELYDSGGEGASMWDNGQLLADLLTQIRQHFGEPVNIVAHSKGGIDSQAALIHYGAWPHVGRVVTLGSPHRGSHLADLAYSWWAGWLAELLGARDEGTEVLQTGYMEYFRSVTDGHENAGKNAYYTAAGTSWGPFSLGPVDGRSLPVLLRGERRTGQRVEHIAALRPSPVYGGFLIMTTSEWEAPPSPALNPPSAPSPWGKGR